MVGWSRRNAENARRRRDYREWFDSLPLEQRQDIEHANAENWKKDKPVLITLLIITFVLSMLPVIVTIYRGN